MDMWMLILTLIGTVATIVSTIIAVKAKNEVKNIAKNFISISNNKNNSGIVIVDNSGRINNTR